MNNTQFYKRSTPAIPFYYRPTKFLVHLTLLGLKQVACEDPIYTYSGTKDDFNSRFDKFFANVLSCRRHKFFPVLRVSDGEYIILFGRRPYISPQRPIYSFLEIVSVFRHYLSDVYHPRTANIYSSGKFSRHDLKCLKAACLRSLNSMLRQDYYVAFHTDIAGKPFLEQYLRPVDSLLNSAGPSRERMIPFYFVYALLSPFYLQQLIRGQRLLIVTGMNEEKRRSAKQYLIGYGCISVDFHVISSTLSHREEHDFTYTKNRFDVIFIGAGAGKFPLIESLRPSCAPCIDAGYMLEVFADRSLAGKRPFTC